MKYERIEIRLDEDHLRKVAELKAAYGVSASEVLRRGIDKIYEEQARERRLEIVRQMVDANLEDVPDMATLKRQLGRDRDHLQDDIADPA